MQHARDADRAVRHPRPPGRPGGDALRRQHPEGAAGPRALARPARWSSRSPRAAWTSAPPSTSGRSCSPVARRARRPAGVGGPRRAARPADRLVVLYEGRSSARWPPRDADPRAARHADGRPRKWRREADARSRIWSARPVARRSSAVAASRSLITAVPILLAGANPIEAYDALRDHAADLAVHGCSRCSSAPRRSCSPAPRWRSRSGPATGTSAPRASCCSARSRRPARHRRSADLPPVVALPLMVVGGRAGGRRVGARCRRCCACASGIDEVVTTLLLNPVALLLVNGAAPRPVARPGHRLPRLAAHRRVGRVPALLVDRSRLHLGFLLALVVIAVAWYVLAGPRPACGCARRA